MTTWFISRHTAAIEWVRLQSFSVDRWVSHLDPALIEAGDVVIGTLPMHLAEAVCKRGATFYFLLLPLQQEQRGQELALDDMLAAGCSVQRYLVASGDWQVCDGQCNPTAMQY
jgi:CRISPR-associated protein Csx16